MEFRIADTFTDSLGRLTRDVAEAGHRVARLGSFADLRQHFVEEDAEQLAAFRAAPILRQFGHQRVRGRQDDPFVLIRRRDISSEMSNGDPLA